MPGFNVGDLVRLKSGGPTMTVSNPVAIRSECECQWFDDAGKLQKGRFVPLSLEVAEDEDGEE